MPLTTAERLKQDLIRHLQQWEARRDRAQQTLIGASELHGCRRQVWYKINKQEKVNFPQTGLGALIGTGFHMIAEDAYDDLTNLRDGQLRYTEYTGPGLPAIGLGPAHVDRVDLTDKRVVDYKTCKLKDMRWMPKEKHFTQVQTYAERLISAGLDITEVAVFYVPRDGEYEDIAVYVRPVEVRQAEAAHEWLLELQSMTTPPDPDYKGRICSEYCPFYGPDTCVGKLD